MESKPKIRPEFRLPSFPIVGKETSLQVSEYFSQLGDILVNVIQPSRELTLAMRNLEIGHLYAQKALATSLGNTLPGSSPK